MSKKTHVTGFTLIELMIVLTVIGILTAIVYPSYVDKVRRAKRIDAQATLVSIQLAQANYRATNTTYGTLAQVFDSVTSLQDDLYTLAITNISATSYTITATAQNDQTNDAEQGTNCTTLSIIVNGANTTKSPVNCWIN